MIISQTPLRISFFGGGTDISSYYQQYGGSVVSTTIDKYIYIIIKSRFDRTIVLNYSEREHVDNVNQIHHGLFREAMKMVGVTEGVEITSIADIPSQGSGLGSSSSFTVGLLNALYAFIGDVKSSEELAMLACHLEIEVLKEPIGKQDQYAAALGGLRHYRFHEDGAVEAHRIGLSSNKVLELENSCLLFYTGITRKASKVLSEQKENTGRNIESLHSIKRHVSEQFTNFASCDIKALGRALHESWEEKKKLASGISNPAIDEMYRMALGAGAYGGKILGAGGGGFLLVLASSTKVSDVRSTMQAYTELDFQFAPYGTRIIFQIDESSGNRS